MSKTFREVIEACGEDFEPTVTLDDGSTISAACWTDDEEVLAWPARFDVATSLDRGNGTAIGRYDNLHGELDGALNILCKQIGDKVGGEWFYSPADCQIVEA